MRIVIPAPPQTREGRSLHGSALEPLPPLVPREWIDYTIRAAAPEGHSLRTRYSAEAESRSGWPVSLWSAELVDASGVVVEHRLIVFYRFVYFGGTAEIRASTPIGVDDEPLVQAMLDCAPDVSGTIACLADVYG